MPLQALIIVQMSRCLIFNYACCQELVKGRGTLAFSYYFLVPGPMFSLGGTETQDSILKILECIKVVKYAVKIMLECTL